MKIKKIEKIKVEVDEIGPKDHNIYIDTDSVFFSASPILDVRHNKWKERSDNEIAMLVNEVAQEIQDYLNSFYDVFAKKVLNVTEHRLDIKKEYVAKAGLWVAKKRYAQWIISDNGVPVDKLDVKGLDVKRSSFPKAFQEIMGDVLISILRSKTEDEITENISKFKKSMRDLPIEDIAKNSAVKNMSKYIPDGNREAFSTVKGTPAHVKSAIAYNDLLKHFELPYKYEPMKDGDKIKWVYLKNNPLGIDGCGFVGYNDPDEIMEFINTYVDHDKIFERELRSKLQDFYDAVGWGNVVSQQKKAGQFFSF